MSYILDALQRADAERARGGVPGLHARQMVATALPTSGAAQRGIWWLLAVVAALATVAGGYWLTRVPAVATTPATVPAVADTLAPREVVVVPSIPIPAPAPAPVSVPAPAPVVASPALEAPPPKARSVAPTPAPTLTPTIAVKPTQAVAAASRASAAPPATAIPWFADLPQDLRQGIPKLTITGTVYSENPAQRLLVVNGQVLTQGSEVAPELSLAEIHPTHSDFIFRGTRFRMPH